MTFSGNGNGSGDADELLQLRKELQKAQRAKAEEVKRFQQVTKKSRHSKWVLHYVDEEPVEIVEEDEDEPEEAEPKEATVDNG